MRRAAVVAASLAVLGCAGLPVRSSEPPPSALLRRADDQVTAAQYKSALALYD